LKADTWDVAGLRTAALVLATPLGWRAENECATICKDITFGESFSTARGRRLLDGCVGSLLFSQQARAEEAWRIQNSMTFPTAQSNSCSFELLRQIYVLNTVLPYEPG